MTEHLHIYFLSNDAIYNFLFFSLFILIYSHNLLPALHGRFTQLVHNKSCELKTFVLKAMTQFFTYKYMKKIF